MNNHNDRNDQIVETIRLLKLQMRDAAKRRLAILADVCGRIASEGDASLIFERGATPEECKLSDAYRNVHDYAQNTIEALDVMLWEEDMAAER